MNPAIVFALSLALLAFAGVSSRQPSERSECPTLLWSCSSPLPSAETRARERPPRQTAHAMLTAGAGALAHPVTQHCAVLLGADASRRQSNCWRACFPSGHAFWACEQSDSSTSQPTATARFGSRAGANSTSRAPASSRPAKRC